MKTLITISIILTLMGLVSFSQFILQEAHQTVQWALRTNDPDLQIRGQRLTARIISRMRALNHFAWINPYAALSYKSWIESHLPNRSSDPEKRYKDKRPASGST